MSDNLKLNKCLNLCYTKYDTPILNTDSNLIQQVIPEPKKQGYNPKRKKITSKKTPNTQQQGQPQNDSQSNAQQINELKQNYKFKYISDTNIQKCILETNSDKRFCSNLNTECKISDYDNLNETTLNNKCKNILLEVTNVAKYICDNSSTKNNCNASLKIISAVTCKATNNNAICTLNNELSKS